MTSPWAKATEPASAPVAPVVGTDGLTDAQRAVKNDDKHVMFNVEQHREANRNLRQGMGNLNLRGGRLGWQDGPLGFNTTPDAPIMAHVDSRPLLKYNAHIEEPEGIATHKAIVRSDNEALLGVVGEDYQIVQTADVIRAHENAIERAFPADKLRHVYVRDETSRGGAFVKRNYVFPDLVARVSESKRGKYGADTDVMLRSSIYTTHDGHGSAACAFSSIDGFCSNSLVYSHMDIFKRRHTSGFKMPEQQFQTHAEAALERWRDSLALIQAWADYRFTSQQCKELLEALPSISQLRREKMEARFDQEAVRRGQTLWALVSAMTYYASHNDKDSGFGVRGSGKRDNEAETLNKREAEVLVWIQSDPFKRISHQARHAANL